MTKGILIFAINSTFDYLSAAEFAAKQAKKYLNLPVTLVTNEQVDIPVFDNVIVIADTSSTVRSIVKSDGSHVTTQWFNESRVQAYDLSPYDQTLLIDADYFMFNSSLLPLFDSESELACFTEINDITGDCIPQVRIDEISIPMQWATVLYFKKCLMTKCVFDFMKRIKSEWHYYSMLYYFKEHNFRNDFALSIALQALTGYSTLNFNRIPGKLHTLFGHIDVISVKNDSEIVFSWNNQINKITGTNLHCMNKLAIPRFYE